MIYVWCAIKIVLMWVASHLRLALVGVAVLAIAVVGFRSCIRPDQQTAAQQKMTVQEQKAPSVQDAGYILQTYSRIYYLVQFKEVTKDSLMLFRWYEWGKNSWVLQQSKQGVPYDRQVQGDYRLIKR